MRRAILAAVVLWGSAASAEDVPQPPIRDFDLATTEKLGRAMADQDREAWKATDILFAKHPKSDLVAEKQHGWVVVNTPTGDVVRFTRETGGGIEIAYEVAFVDGKPSELTVPENKVPSAEERAQYDARLLALDNIDKPCSQTYNTVALKDPQGDGWLVWAMAATTDPSFVVIGGHYRFTISKDGKTIVRKDALSHGCLNLKKDAEKKDVENMGVFAAQLVALQPTENHVFANLSYGIPLHVGTRDGRNWRIDQGRIARTEMDSPGIDGFAARALSGYDEICKSIIEKPLDGVPKYFIGDAPKVIEATESAAKYAIEPPPGARVVSVTCGRLDIVPAPNDYKVLLAGYNLRLLDRGAGHPKNEILLTLKDGKVAYEPQGDVPLSDERKSRIAARIPALQAKVATP